MVEPIVWPQGETEPDSEHRDRYDYAVGTMADHTIVVLTTSDLPNMARAARLDLGV